MSLYFPFDPDNGIYEKSYTNLINNAIKLSHRISFHCASIVDCFLAVGCNTGNIYVFKVENEKFKYYSNIISNEVRVDNLQFSPLKLYLAYSNIKFQIFIYKLDLTNETNQLVRQIDTVHNCLISSLMWDNDSCRLFCGFKNEIIDVIHMPAQSKDLFQIPPETIFKMDKQTIIQMDIIKDTLLVSTNEKVVLINLQTKFSILVGSKPRSGLYGACFWFCESRTLKVIAARPSYRLWIASSDGTVEETQQYKNWTNSPKHKISSTEENTSGTGQFSWLYPIKNNLIFAGDSGGLILIIDLILKSCLISIDCGSNLSKTIHSNKGLIIICFNREVINISVKSVCEALVQIINENINLKYAIDLFLSLNFENEHDKTSERQQEIRKIYNNFTPNLLTLIVEKSVELDYRFVETNKLQVDIIDDGDYQKMYYSIRGDPITPPRISNSSSTELAAESSMESDTTSLLSIKKKTQSLTKMKNITRASPLLQTIFDKASTMLSNIDVMNSSNSELNSLDSFSNIGSREDLYDGVNTHTKENRILRIHHERSGNAINLMELEANVFISWERMRQQTITDDINIKNEFIDSLSNFCESWLELNFRHWQKLFFMQLNILNLSASFPNFSSKSKEGLDINNRSADGFVPNEELNYLYCNSWSNSIHVSEWMKPLPVSEKITVMTSTLLSQCFSNRIFPLFPDLITYICEITGIKKSKYLIEFVNFESTECINDKSTQFNGLMNCTQCEEIETTYRYPDLLSKLKNEIWSIESDCLWIKAMILLFHSVINLKDLRNWIVSCLSQEVWLTIIQSLKEINSTILSKEEYQLLLMKPQSELDVLLFNNLCHYNIESLILCDTLFYFMKQRGSINWKIIIESENLECRDILHFSIKHDIDLTDYIVYLFKHAHLSTKFYSKYHLIEHIYSQPDILISFIYTLLNNRLVHTFKDNTCTCGMITSFSKFNLPENISSIVIEILKWGSDQNIFKSNAKILDLMSTLCIDIGFHHGYVELLVGLCDVKKLINIGVQVSNIEIIERIKDCNLSSQSLKYIIEFLISVRRKQINSHCLYCNNQFQNDGSVPLLSWRDLGELIFTKLIEKTDNQTMQQSIIKMLNETEIEEMKEYLVDSINIIVNSNKIVVKGQMYDFINNEMNQAEDSANLTELYLNIYAMHHSELCGTNWGKIMTQNMPCNVCGMILIEKTLTSRIRDIISFSCNHTFHKKCIQDIGCEKFCFMCC